MTIPCKDKEADRRKGWADRHCRPAAARRPSRILVVDDNDDAREYLSLMLELSGHTVDSARDGDEALEVAERFRPEIIFLDIQMPKLSGLEVCREIRAKQWGRTIAIYAVTGLDSTEDNARSQQYGFDGHLLKPVDPSMLDSIVLGKPSFTEPVRGRRYD